MERETQEQIEVRLNAAEEAHLTETRLEQDRNKSDGVTYGVGSFNVTTYSHDDAVRAAYEERAHNYN